jgi:hypothetical protein
MLAGHVDWTNLTGGYRSAGSGTVEQTCRTAQLANRSISVRVGRGVIPGLTPPSPQPARLT